MNTVNLTLLTDFYELTMANGYFEHGLKDEIAYFDMFLNTAERKSFFHHFEKQPTETFPLRKPVRQTEYLSQ